MIGTKLAHYSITGHLGSGGMGDVYQATDSKLGRDVAIKLLPEAFTHDADRTARFEREARILASLNHPNIAAIYGVEESDGRNFLVMELVLGETLAERIKRGPIGIDEALNISKSICEALEAAHDKGVVHRDLKPANVKITPEGKVKVLDFGLAKAMEHAPTTTLSNSPTLSMAATNAGVILGTAAYMSPEQAKGREVDRRTDIFAFGAVLYEMLTGRRLFSGETTSETMAAVMMKEPDWSALPAKTPGRLRELLRRCLIKEPRSRLQAMGDARIAIEEALSGSEVDGHVTPVASRRLERLAWISLVTVIAAPLAVLGVMHFRGAPPVAPSEMRLEITTPPTADPASLAISPDGKKIVFAAAGEGRSRLWLRSLDAVSSRPLAGTDGAAYPFWSPDSRSVGFFADGKLKRIDIDGGSVQALANAVTGFGGAWNRDGTILFAPNGVGSIFRIPATGGDPTAVTRLEAPQQLNNSFPQFLPDDRHFLYYVQGNSETRGIYIGQLGGSEARRLVDSDASAVYVPSGQLLFVHQGTLFAQNFDPTRLELSGNPSPVAEQVAVNAFNLAALSASASGVIVYRTGSAGVQQQFVWFDRSGREIGKVGSPDNANQRSPFLSPDGRRVALDRRINQNSDVWFLDLERSVFNRFTSSTSAEIFPIWSPDGNSIVFASNRNGGSDLYQKLTTGAGNEEQLLVSSQIKGPVDWSPDGRFILYRSLDPKTGWDLWALPLDGDRKPYPVARTEFDERDGQFSPDGKWIGYQSNESGRPEIYVQAFPGPGGKVQMSTAGGAQVRWRRDGKELFYVALDDRLMAIPIQIRTNAPTVEPGTPIPLFTTRVGGAVQTVNRQQYVVSPDGQRFLMNTIIEETPSPITVILNWKGKP